jgi:hypothetical protein
MTLLDRKLLGDTRQADKRARISTIAWRRKQLIERRYVLEDQWQVLFPHMTSQRFGLSHCRRAGMANPGAAQRANMPKNASEWGLQNERR